MSDEEEDVEIEEDEIDEAESGESEDEGYIPEYCAEDEPDEVELNDTIQKTLRADWMDVHPQERIINCDEALLLCIVERDETGTIIDDKHITLPILTKYEYTRILGIRANQIEQGAPLFIEVPDSLIDSYLIAKEELHAKKLPFIIKRPIPNGPIEYWKLADLELLF
jgi:DNA-directed RNA polymerase subunit K/omega